MKKYFPPAFFVGGKHFVGTRHFAKEILIQPIKQRLCLTTDKKCNTATGILIYSNSFLFLPAFETNKTNQGKCEAYSRYISSLSPTENALKRSSHNPCDFLLPCHLSKQGFGAGVKPAAEGSERSVKNIYENKPP